MQTESKAGKCSCRLGNNYINYISLFCSVPNCQYCHKSLQIKKKNSYYNYVLQVRVWEFCGYAN